MSSRHKPSLLGLVESYFQSHLRRVRGASEHTLRAYRDGLRLYFVFLAKHTGRTIAKLAIEDVRADTVLAFLDHLETTRGNSATTRNCRLAALRAFAAHLLRHDLAHAEQYRRLLSIPSKKTRSRGVVYLEPEEVQSLLAQPDRKSKRGRRDLALLLFLYNTGARISEALGVKPSDLYLQRPRQVRVRGKGNKERTCPLWPETAAALQSILRESANAGDAPIFQTLRQTTLSRDAVAHLLEKYVRKAALTVPSLRRRRVTPHVLRHSCAVGLLQSGVDVTVIRDYLGHTSVATTNRYITTNMEMKRKVLDAFWRRSGLQPNSKRPWRPSPALLKFLESL